MKPKMLAYFRKKRGIEQARLAEKLDVHVITISRWERGISEPRASEITKLCEVLGVSEAELLKMSRVLFVMAARTASALWMSTKRVVMPTSDRM